MSRIYPLRLHMLSPAISVSSTSVFFGTSVVSIICFCSYFCIYYLSWHIYRLSTSVSTLSLCLLSITPSVSANCHDFFYIYIFFIDFLFLYLLSISTVAAFFYFRVNFAGENRRRVKIVPNFYT